MGVPLLGSGRGPSGSSRTWSALAAIVLLGLAAVVGWRHATGPGGTPQVQQASYVKVPSPGDDFPRLPSRCADPGSPMPFEPCPITHFAGRPTVVVWGDSHALMYLPVLRTEAQTHRDNLVLIVAGGCPPAVPAPGAVGHLGCEDHDAAAVAYLRRLSAAHTHHGTVSGLRVVIGSFWDGYRSGLAHNTANAAGTLDASEEAYEQRMKVLARDGTAPLFRRLGQLHVPTDVIGEAAIVPTSPADCPAGRTPYRCDVPRSQALPDGARTHAWLISLMQGLPAGSRYIDPTPFYCDSTVCHGVVDGVDTWFDDVHLGAGLTALMGRYFAPTFAVLG